MGRGRVLGNRPRGDSRNPCLFVWIVFRSIVEVEIGADDLRTHYDLIVVGTGPAGLTLARKYEELTGGQVLVIESGSRTRDNNNAQTLPRWPPLAIFLQPTTHSTIRGFLVAHLPFGVGGAPYWKNARS